MLPAPLSNLRIAYAAPLKLEVYSVLEVKRQRRAVTGAGMQLRGDGWTGTGTGVGRGRRAHPKLPQQCSLLTPSEPQAPLKTSVFLLLQPRSDPWLCLPSNVCDIYARSTCRNHIQTSKSPSSNWLETGRILWKPYMLALFL